VPHGSLGRIVRRLDSWHRRECPQARFDAQEVTTGADGLDAAASRSGFQEAMDFLTQPGQNLPLKPFSVLNPVVRPRPLFGEDIGVHQQVLADRRPPVATVDHRLEIGTQMCPADLTLITSRWVWTE
jgi:hypothetical protein